MSASGLQADASARYQTLLEISEAMVLHQQIATLLPALIESLRRIVPFDGISVTLYNAEERTVRLYAAVTPNNFQAPVGRTFRVEDTPGKLVLETGEPVYVPDLQADDRFPIIHSLMRSAGARSYVVLPMTTARRRFLGSLNFASLTRDAYSAADTSFMQQVSRLVGIAVENVLNYEAAASYQQELARDRDHLRLLLDVNTAVVQHLDIPQLLSTVSECLRNALRVDAVGLLLLNEAGELRRYLADLPEGQESDNMLVPFDSPPGRALAKREPVLVSREELKSVPERLRGPIADRGIERACCLPLVSRGRALGVLPIASRHVDAFPEEHVRLAMEVAGQVAIALDNALSYRKIEHLNARLAQEKIYLEDEIRTQYGFEEIIGRSPSLMSVLRSVETVAPSDSAVVVYGETGTGKELVARAIHDLSARRNRTFVKLNCAAIPTGLLESELFGHERGAFTGAIARRVGRFELAHGGTLFLDEVGEIPLELQPKLLRVLQEQEFERLGSSRTMRVDVRVVAATNRDLLQMVRERKFRDDLYYRLNVFPVHLPPLRERREDIPVLVRHFAQQCARRMRKEITTIPSETMEALVRYSWPGNVRELQNLIERAVIVSSGPALQVPIEELHGAPVAAGVSVTLEDAERTHIVEVLRSTNWVLAGPGGAAARLGMKRSTLQFRMKKLGIARP